MTLLFFLRSPAGNTDAVSAPDAAGTYWDYDDAKPKRKKKLTAKEKREIERLARESLKATAESAAIEALGVQRKIRRRKDEEALLMLFMHEFDGYDD